ncbi:class I SAM-dependent methyltransferase [Maribacter sp. MMG018]|uniref:class I SAM-dependent methyltransferase n=1 Tax=Maribacter sp. MMG018 TaxID=2822688 RepID=UPI001B3953F7|nr:class I SAM-dependent methyltransferase [Maribacter sp. MMG018]MBQ4914164.1 class I SAM-dependent methyltransferase [Maribacter sp. MMG018]
MQTDILGKALLDYQRGNYTEDIKTYSSLDEEDTLPLPYLFRGYDQMPPLEQKALQLCKGSVLDIGCGAGSHSLYLQEKGYDVTGLDRSEGAIKVCTERGLKQTIRHDLLDIEDMQFDTLLLMMNGIGIVGLLSNIDLYLNKMKSILKPNGQILLDSSDILYMFENDDDGGYWVPDDVNYYGEVTFNMEYRNEKGTPFNWLYLDFNTLKRAANYHGFSCELISNGQHNDYLAKLALE